MEYRGYFIDDKFHYIDGGSKKFYEDDTNSLEFGITEVETLLNQMKETEEEQKKLGNINPNVTVEIYANGDHYPDDYAECRVSINWSRLETEEERDKRIQAEKERIDWRIEDEKRQQDFQRKIEEADLEHAEELIRAKGGKIIYGEG